MIAHCHSSSFRAFAFAVVVATLLPGCESLSPSHLWKLNRHPPLGQEDAYFSIPNDAPAAAAANSRKNTADSLDAPDADSVAS
jgi:hypothetical protein